MAFNNRNNKAKVHGVARVISKRGYCSRSQAEKLVCEGHVILRGKPVCDPESPAYENDEILVNGKPVTASDFVYFAMNKPRGIVTTASDEKGRKTVMDLFREEYAKMYPGKPMPHIAPVGRLDAASEGLLLFTNDTAWADRVLTDASHIKIYRVQVKGKPSATELKQMEAGFNVPPRIFGEKEEFMHAECAAIASVGEKNCWLEITLSEGKNREIRRMLAHLGYEVLRLMRIQFDNFTLNDLKPGEIRVIQV
ncbi:MAG: pseudouridine synthase [Fibrobacter sp.]|uniref:pseudouridine synthase n=1 Tax=Fibrobacter sp. TaxID=35828 RepID=UPI002A91D1D6|nr:pseudouridine synthase [Fibrobacter sp.]MDY6263352.1 pseudouridine synthase [Fibrobacter sp.]